MLSATALLLTQLAMATPADFIERGPLRVGVAGGVYAPPRSQGPLAPTAQVFVAWAFLPQLALEGSFELAQRRDGRHRLGSLGLVYLIDQIPSVSPYLGAYAQLRRTWLPGVPAQTFLHAAFGLGAWFELGDRLAIGPEARYGYLLGVGTLGFGQTYLLRFSVEIF